MTAGRNAMTKLRNEKGIALITALMFTLICLGMVMALMQMLLVETQQSASHKMYRSALDASYGGTDLVTKEFLPRLPLSDYASSYTALVSAFTGTGPGHIDLATSGSAALQTKLSSNTVDWGTLSKTIDPKDTPDFRFDLQGEKSQKFRVYAKIVDTVQGNSDTTGIDYLDTGAGVAGTGAGISPKHNPALYTIEVQGEKATNPKEKAKLSVLYAY